jgi:hypothetical protein
LQLNIIFIIQILSLETSPYAAISFYFNHLKFTNVKQTTFLPAVALAAVFLCSSCGGEKEKTTDTTVTTDTPAAPESTVVTAPETIITAWHKVANFAKWKVSYDAHDSMRLAGGIHSYVIGRSVEDSNLVLVAIKADDVAKAKAFIKDPSLKAAMQKGGVIGQPSININTMAYQDMSTSMADLRSMTMFTVKDWDAWKTAFESNRQFRSDNGLTDRAYGYNADDNHKVTLVVAINDTAKASALWKSDIIKQKRAESGVVGEVKRYVYRVVQKY